MLQTVFFIKGYRRYGVWLCIDPGKTANTLNKINVHDLHEYSTFFLIGLVKPEITFEMRLFSGFDSHAMLSRFDGNRFIFSNHKLY